uniref:RNA-directed DNA polymerase, eukaryota, reverse transcriptase zinc-binding domain protein n=1 Tax=Tanacetum cinerariifolium TaxID=118510 RepID=A0A6L2LBD7_TANCI|nr:RNA-directed DNA polymerase, eukaryota, reverse transcriptase zinc-binding domain protein [Tanacetum cinerariifolium]
MNIGSVALDRKLSDHCPIVLLDKGLDFGPKPFRFFDAWMEETDFQELVRNAWMESVSTSNPDCVLRGKLKNVKMALKAWSKEKYRGLDREIETARKEADSWEKEAESRTLQDHELELWQKARADWIEKDGIKAKMLKQKARIQCRIKRLSENEASLLEAEFEEKEVWEAVKSCGSSKALEFLLQRGIRQGDPLSPFLFLLIAEGLNIMMQEVLNRGLFEVLGLKVNLNKSKLYGVGIHMDEIEDYARSLDCRAGKLPFLLFRASSCLKAMNWALLSKWWWRFRVENEALWVKVIKSLHGAGGGLLEDNISCTGNSVWGNIVKVGRDLGGILISLPSTVNWEVGDGKAILFWDDIWVGGRRLRERFPRLYHLEACKEVSVGNKGGWRGDDWTWEWCWRNTPRGRVMRDITEICNLVQYVQLNKNVKDKCRWELSEDRKFSVKDLRDLIDEKTLGLTRRQFATPCGINRERLKSVIWSTLYIIWSNRNVILRRNGSMIPDLFKFSCDFLDGFRPGRRRMMRSGKSGSMFRTIVTD